MANSLFGWAQEFLSTWGCLVIVISINLVSNHISLSPGYASLLQSGAFPQMLHLHQEINGPIFSF